eukprot:6195503-Pleurochrysis_carterae.AAC.2
MTVIRKFKAVLKKAANSLLCVHNIRCREAQAAKVESSMRKPSFLERARLPVKRTTNSTHRRHICQGQSPLLLAPLPPSSSAAASALVPLRRCRSHSRPSPFSAAAHTSLPAHTRLPLCFALRSRMTDDSTIATLHILPTLDANSSVYPTQGLPLSSQGVP